MSALAFLAGDGEVIGRRAGRPVSRSRFLGAIAGLAEAMPERSHVVNFCADRIRFAQGLAAAMLRGQITLLPGDGSARAVAGLLAEYPGLYVLRDQAGEDMPCPVLDFPTEARESDLVPRFPADQVACVLFTSGSTGRPMPSVRRWGRLVASSDAAGAALGVADHAAAAVVATVPHAHSYGLESAVMLPLRHGLLLDAERPFYPGDVAAALAGGGLLVTTPVHLRALLGEAARPGFVLSATAPLSEELAAMAEAAFAAPVFEIFGCSEAGQLATRRTLAGPAWRCLDGFAVRLDGADAWAEGPGEPPVPLADRIEAVDAGFVLRGRAADQVNVAGKRASLAHLTAELLAIPGVRDGAFLAPDGAPRLAALAVAPGLDAEAVLCRLRERIEPAFLPRPLRLVPAMPRDAVGKLAREKLLRMLAPPVLRFAEDHPAGAGHFPGNPIIPGAVLLDAMLPLLDAGAGKIASAKFHHPVRPGEAVEISRDGRRFEARLVPGAKLVVSGIVEAASPSP